MPADSLAALDSDGSPRHLVVDALNLLTDYFLPDFRGACKGDAWTMLAVLRRRVAGFLEACANTTPALVPHFVIDAGWQSEEAATKWRKRREKEVRAHARDIPLSADTFLADALRAAGAKVYQVEGEDGDDIVAVLAQALGATSLILSADRDMFRYDDTVLPDAPKRVAAAFSFAEVEKKQNHAPRFGVALHASPTKQPKEGVSRRGAEDVPRFDPAEDFERWSRPYDKLKTVVDDPRRGYVRGACSPQTRAFGNLHGHSRPLRLAAYRLMGARGSVHERFPEWDDANDDVRWEDADVDVDGGTSDEKAETRTAETFLRAAVSGTADDENDARVSALRWLRARDPAWLFASARGEDDTHTFRGFARFAIVAECFAAARRSQDVKKKDISVLATALAMRDRAEKESETSFARETKNVARRISAKKKKEINALFAFPPASHRSSLCSERACGARFVLSKGERAFLAEKGFAPPTRCKPCRDARKASREGRGAPRASLSAVSATPSSPVRAPSPGTPGGTPGGTRVGVRPPRTLKAPSLSTDAAETAEKLAALAVSRGEADE